MREAQHAVENFIAPSQLAEERCSKDRMIGESGKVYMYFVQPPKTGAIKTSEQITLDKKLGLLRLNTMRKLVANMKH